MAMVIIDYGMGNLRSVQKAFEVCGAKPIVTSNAAAIEKADKIVLPGVGAFGQAMHELKKKKLLGVLKDKLNSGTPYLGLCLGLQLLFSSSEEAGVQGLDILPGRVKLFSGKGSAVLDGATRLKVPHMGWNTISIKKKGCPILKGVHALDHYYFVHSFYAVPEEKKDILSTTRYGVEFCSSVWRGHIFATQFHPEKSQQQGLTLIKNFIAYEAR